MEAALLKNLVLIVAKRTQS